MCQALCRVLEYKEACREGVVLPPWGGPRPFLESGFPLPRGPVPPPRMHVTQAGQSGFSQGFHVATQRERVLAPLGP